MMPKRVLMYAEESCISIFATFCADKKLDFHSGWFSESVVCGLAMMGA